MSLIVRSIQRILKYPPTRALSGDERQLLWKFRFSLMSEKRALTKFLRCVEWSDVQVSISFLFLFFLVNSNVWANIWENYSLIILSLYLFCLNLLSLSLSLSLSLVPPSISSNSSWQHLLIILCYHLSYNTRAYMVCHVVSLEYIHIL